MRKVFVFILSSVLIYSCTPEFEPVEIKSGEADFTTSIAIGDGYLAGYQDGVLSKDGQEHSIAAILQRSFEQAGSNNFNQALMPDNIGLGISSKPWEGSYITISKMGDRVDCKGVTTLGPVKTFHTTASAQTYLNSVSVANLNDFSFPFAKSNQLFSANFYSQNVFYNRVATSFGNASVIAAAMSKQPTFFTAWLGMEDIYGFARNGGRFGTIPSPASFSATLDSILGTLTSNGAKGVIATIPEIEIFPYYTLIPWNSANLTLVKADSLNLLYSNSGITHVVFSEGNNAFVIEDVNAPYGFRKMLEGEYMTIQVPLDSMKCYYYGIFANLIHDRYALDTAELSFIRDRISDYNAIIVQKAAQYDLALADMNAYYNRLETGIYSNGVLFTNEFVSGGFFSLDGYYPTQKGAALIANQFILAINAKYQSTLPTIYCDDCNGVIFP